MFVPSSRQRLFCVYVCVKASPAVYHFDISISYSYLQEEFYGRKLILADREEVEQEADNIFKDADVTDVALLVVGDPFG